MHQSRDNGACARRDALRGGAAFAAFMLLGGARTLAGRDPPNPLPCPVSLPGDGDHARFCSSWNGCFRGRPSMVAHARSAADIAAALRFAKVQGMPVAVRSGGHSFAGASVIDGLVIDLSAMREIAAAEEVDGRASVIHAGGGVRIGALESALYHRFGERAVTLGSCGSVGVSGLTLGGGFNAMSRVHGLTIDALSEVEAVLADGTVVSASERSNQDLFWALRGGGAGFAVVTRMSFRTRPWKQTHAQTQHWKWSDGATVLERWSQWIESLPEGASSSLVWMTSGNAANSDIRTVVRTERGHAAATKLAESLAAALGGAAVRTRAWTTGAPSVRIAEPSSGPRTANASAFAEGAINAETAQAVADRFRARCDPRGAATEGTAMLLCNAFKGAVTQIAPDATAFPHRRACLLAEFAAEWPAGRTDLDEANRAWVRATADGVRGGFGTGSYVNYADLGLQAWREAYWGTNLPRLQAIRAKLDPTGLLAGKVAP